MPKYLILTLILFAHLNTTARMSAILSSLSEKEFSSGKTDGNDFHPEIKKHPKLRFHEKKGTIGTLLPLTLGPVGYLIIRLSSHDQVVIEHAKKAISVWIVLAALGGMLWYGGTYNNTVLGKAFCDILGAILQSAVNNN